MSNHKIYAQTRVKVAALEAQQKTVTEKLRSNVKEQQEAKNHLTDVSKRADELRGMAIRGTASAEELEHIKTEKQLAKTALEESRGDEKILHDEVNKLSVELSCASNAATEALKKLCSGITGQIESALKSDKKLRAAIVDIFVAYHAMTDRSLGGSFGSVVIWDAVLMDIFPEPEGEEFNVAYNRFKSELAK